MTKPRLRVLYAEDNTSDVDLVASHFGRVAPHIELEAVPTGRECLHRIRSASYDVLLLDNHLRDMDGVQVLTQMAPDGIPMPVVVVTAVGDEDLVVQVLRLGACDYVPKHGLYIERLPGVLENAAAEYAKLGREGRTPGMRRRIVYAEHTAADIDLTLRHFADNAPHLKIEVVHSAADALARLREGTLDLLLADLRMPDMSTIELLRESRHLGLRIPILVVTGRGDDAAAAAALKLGAADYIVKRDDYLLQLPYAIENAIHRSQLMRTNDRLQEELAERERTEEQLRQAQKMESIGRLAGGIAHDFNNLVTAINGYTDLITQDLGPTHPLRNDLAQIRRAGDRAADLTRQLLAFSRRQLLQPRVVGLNVLVADTTQMLGRVLGEDVQLVTVLDPHAGMVKADAGQIDQVIMNLAVNARDAMPRGGKLTLETRAVQIDEAYSEAHLSMPPGSYVMLSVSDTGTGMDADTMANAFEPFFTTKEPGKGTGLGLSTVYGIVKQSGGWIWAYSELGKGTTFKIYLPRVAEAAAEAVEKRAEVRSPNGTERVLVVEDDAMVRRLITQTLRKHGYEVVESSNGADALQIVAVDDRPLALLVTDVVMPGMSGLELAENLRRSRPVIHVLFMSGYTDDAVVRHGLLDAAMAFLQKPFTPSGLARKVREVLDERATMADETRKT